jgi:RNA polymerase sigma-70 factor (ECF subfamily)
LDVEKLATWSASFFFCEAGNSASTLSVYGSEFAIRKERGMTSVALQVLRPPKKKSHLRTPYRVAFEEITSVFALAATRNEKIQLQPSERISLQSAPDETIITLFQSGEKEVYRLLVDRYQERVRNLLFSIFHEQDFIADLAQDVFIKAYQALPNFRFESSFYTWLYRIAVNKSRDELRRRKLRRFFSFQALDEGVAQELEFKMATPPENRDAHEIISMGLKLLPEKFRTAIILKDIEGLSYDEIADVMQCELGTVKSRLSRGRTMLRKAVKPLLEEVPE